VVNSTRLIDYEGGPAILGIITDISIRKSIERQLRASEQSYRTLLDTCPDAIVATDLEGNMVIANDAAARLRGFSDVEALLRDGGNSLETIVPEQRGRAAEGLARTLQEGTVQRFEYDIAARDGERTIPVELTTSVLRSHRAAGCRS